MENLKARELQNKIQSIIDNGEFYENGGVEFIELFDQQTKELGEEIERLKERIQHLIPIDDDYYNH